MNLLAQMLSANNEVSSTRAMMLITGAIVLTRFIAFNVANIIHNKGGFDFSPTDVALLGVVLAGKVGQTIFGEKK